MLTNLHPFARTWMSTGKLPLPSGNTLTMPSRKGKVAFAKLLPVEKAGFTELPQTWEQFQDVESKRKAKGITPMAIGNNKQGGDRPNWMMRYFSDQTVEKLVPQLDLDKNGLITSNEIVYGIDSGLIDFTKQPFIDLFPIMKDWTQYWPKGFNGLTVDDANDMFLRGDAAMTLGTPDFAKTVTDVIDYGVMRVPYLTKKTNPNAEEKYYEVAAGNPDGVYAIPASIAPEKMDAAVDFLIKLNEAARKEADSLKASQGWNKDNNYMTKK